MRATRDANTKSVNERENISEMANDMPMQSLFGRCTQKLAWHSIRILRCACDSRVILVSADEEEEVWYRN